MQDPETLAVYDAAVDDYRAAVAADHQAADRARFAAALLPGAHILDLGCGPGHDAAAFAALGFAVDAWDASPNMVAAAAVQPGVTAACHSFADLTAEAAYDGIWASFSLLHAARADLPGHIAAIARALTQGGQVYVAMKLGSGSSRDRLGRFYTYVTEDELTGWLTDAGLTVTGRRAGTGKGLAGTDDAFLCLFAHG